VSGPIMSGQQVQYHEFTCQGCGSHDLESVLDLGYQPLCNEFVPAKEAIRPQTYYPLRLCYCHDCTLVQLDYVIPTGRTFGEQYTYLTGSSPSLVDYYSQLAGKLVRRFDLRPGDAVLDIGSNDGTFLKAFQELGMHVLGVEGAKQPSTIAQRNNVPTLSRFFGRETTAAIKERLQPAGRLRLILAMNVLAHTDNINVFLPEVVSLMEPDTVFVSQSHWLPALIKQCEFDTIYHEHLRYYTLKSLSNLLGRHHLNVVDAELTDFYGGSVLAYASKSSGQQSGEVLSILKQEQEIGILQSLKSMKDVLLRNKARLLNLLVDLKMSGQRVIGIGAPMKASTLLNFYGITPDLVEYLAEVNELKIGTVVPGVRIPVLDEELVFQNQPDYAILLSWNMAQTIIPKYREAGYEGKFILPVPEVEVLE